MRARSPAACLLAISGLVPTLTQLRWLQVRQVLMAVDYMHSHDVVHRDLKLENVMLTQPFTSDTEPDIKVCVFCPRAFVSVRNTAQNESENPTLSCETGARASG